MEALKVGNALVFNRRLVGYSSTGEITEPFSEKFEFE